MGKFGHSDYNLHCKKAWTAIQQLCETDKKLEENLKKYSWSLTYNPTNGRYTLYIQGQHTQWFNFDAYHYVHIHKCYLWNKEGIDSVILEYSDKARGKSSWDLIDYNEYLKLMGKSPMAFALEIL